MYIFHNFVFTNFSDPVIIYKCMFTFSYNVFLFILILQAEGIELNTRPNKNYHSYFSCCHWHVTSLATDNYSTVVALKVYNSIYKYDFICFRENFLDSLFEFDNKNLMLEGYNLIRSDRPNNIKRSNVCIYYKESLPLRLVDITSLPECLVCEVTIQNKRGYVAVMYRSPSQSSIEIEFFLSGFEDMLSSILFSQSHNLLLFQVTRMPDHQYCGQTTLLTLMLP